MDCQVLYRISEKYHTSYKTHWDNFWLWCKVAKSQTHAQLELIPGLLAGLFLLSPGAPVNNCRWASIQWTWDQSINSLET